MRCYEILLYTLFVLFCPPELKGLNYTVLTFLLQLERLPLAWPRTEATAFRRLVPGTGFWILPEDLHALRDVFGLPPQFTKMQEVDLAAKFRVAHRSATSRGPGAAAGIRITELEADLGASHPGRTLKRSISVSDAASSRRSGSGSPSGAELCRKAGSARNWKHGLCRCSPGCEPRGPCGSLPAFGGWCRPEWWPR